MKKILLDTNIIVRFLTEDHHELSDKAEELFKQAQRAELEIIINATTIAESFYVLTSATYQLPPTSAAKLLLQLTKLKNVHFKPERILIKTLFFLSQKRHPSFVDIYNLFYSISQKAELATFDRKLKRLYKQIQAEF